MYLAQIRFGNDGGDDERRDELEDQVHRYLASLVHDGQIGDERLVAWQQGTLGAQVELSRPDALAEKHHSIWGRRDLARLDEAFSQAPECTLLVEAPDEFDSWEESSRLILVTHRHEHGSPIRSDEGEAIPTYLLPLSDDDREHLWFWADRYRLYDHAELSLPQFETAAYRQLADPTSDLGREGRDFCGRIESATGKPTYYYLVRHYGRAQGEETRPCPGCGQAWRDPDVPFDAEGWPRYPLRCEPCRLVSDFAVDREDDLRARIGEFNPRRTDHSQRGRREP